MRKIFSALLLILALGAQAQQDAHYSLYMFNGLFLNPAYAGSHEVLDMMAIYRHQWAGIDGAPRSGNGCIHSPLRRNQYALGLTIAGDRLGLTRSFTATGAFAYRIPVRKSKIALGIQASGTYYAQRNSDAIPAELLAQGYNDAIYAVDRNVLIPNVGAGIYVYGKRYYVGLSAPHLIPMKLDEGVAASMSTALARQYNHYLLTAGCVFGKETAPVKVRPSFLMKYVKGLPKGIPDFDGSLALLFVDRFWLGGTYRVAAGTDNRTGTAAIVWFEALLTNRLRIGYGFDYALSGLNKFARWGSHDIMIGYEFNNRNKRYVSPRYVNYF
ncbi:MAG: type IX secretion system membrane protein PorP/SprF [Chitinophagales bacterium]|nr:type IX secretion system membrane protein PorP/SprF [Chitinophagales bacterium]MDW8419306.1 type IX secretion system membrane protein PorP/SprF [Chitinophagales bacterium]